MSKKSSWKHKLAAVLVSCFMIFVVLFLGEVYCRYFTRINFLDNSKELFMPNRYGRSWGNTPNIEGTSFGHKFHIDADGFRRDPQSVSTAQPDAPAILIVGDSVSFGPGINDNETLTENLRRELPDRRLYDASSIGYFSFDYKNVIDVLIKKKPEIKTVALFFCINDINDVSAIQIKLSANPDVIPDGESEQNSIPEQINRVLRSRSKLYLLIKHSLRDTQLKYFQIDMSFYRDDENLKFGLQPLADIKKTLDEAGVKFKVFLLPYEAQLRPGIPDDFLMPQRKVGEFLKSHNIDYYDPLSELKNAGSPESLYIFDDPMHFSPEGHKILADFVCRNLEENCLAKH